MLPLYRVEEKSNQKRIGCLSSSFPRCCFWICAKTDSFQALTYLNYLCSLYWCLSLLTRAQSLRIVKASRSVSLLTPRCSDTSYTLRGLWACTCLQQQNHFILQLWMVCSVTCGLQRRLRCLCFWEAALLCIKCIALHPPTTLAFNPRSCSPFSNASNTPRMIKCLSQCQQDCSGTEQVSRAVRFVRYLCQVVFIRAWMRPICRLGCQPSPSSQQVFCAVLCVTVSARLVLGEVADCFEFAQYTEYSSAQHSGTNACIHKLATHM